MLVAIFVGLIAGYLAGRVMKDSGYGLFMNLVLGLLGGVVGRIVLSFVGIRAYGIIGSILVATFGAVLLVWIARWFRAGRTS